MKSELPYFGVRMPDFRRSFRQVLRAHPLDSAAELEQALRALWEEADYREDRYAATALTAAHPEWVDLPLLERMIVEGAWWDHVDTLAKQVGRLLPGVASEMRIWARDPNVWKRRVAIICQLGRKEATDLALLRDVIEANLADREFFIRKAIGWALRDYAWHDPLWVDAYVRALGERLSTLSRREATKNLPRLLEAASRRGRT